MKILFYDWKRFPSFYEISSRLFSNLKTEPSPLLALESCRFELDLNGKVQFGKKSLLVNNFNSRWYFHAIKLNYAACIKLFFFNSSVYSHRVPVCNTRCLQQLLNLLLAVIFPESCYFMKNHEIQAFLSHINHLLKFIWRGISISWRIFSSGSKKRILIMKLKITKFVPYPCFETS